MTGRTPHFIPFSGMIRFALRCVQSPLLTASLLISFPAGTQTLHFPAFPILTDLMRSLIKISTVQPVLTSRRSFSQLATSFFGAQAKSSTAKFTSRIIFFCMVFIECELRWDICDNETASAVSPLILNLARPKRSSWEWLSSLLMTVIPGVGGSFLNRHQPENGLVGNFITFLDLLNPKPLAVLTASQNLASFACLMQSERTTVVLQAH